MKLKSWFVTCPFTLPQSFDESTWVGLIYIEIWKLWYNLSSFPQPQPQTPPFDKLYGILKYGIKSRSELQSLPQPITFEGEMENSVFVLLKYGIKSKSDLHVC